MSRPRLLAFGLALLPLAGCAGLHDDSFLAPLGAIEPAAGPPGAGDAGVTEAAALQIMSGVIAGDLLVGGDAAARMLQAPQVMPAAGPADDEAPAGQAGAEATRTAAFERVTAARAGDRQRQTQQALLLERWMSTRVAATPLDRADIRRAQQLLADLGYDPGPIDGFVGPRTRAAVERFQTEQGIAASGEVSPALIDRLAIEQG